MKKRKGLKVVLIVLATIIITWGIINLIGFIFPKKVSDTNPFINDTDKPTMVVAHRGGRGINPEETIKAFDASVNDYNVDILELDVRLTSDNYLILNHDATLNRCTDVMIKTKSTKDYVIREHTYEEIKLFNFGYNFQDDSKMFPYRYVLAGIEDNNRYDKLVELGLSVVTIQEFLDRYKDANVSFIIEIKDKDETGKLATDILCKEIKDRNLIERVVIGTFNDDIEEYIKDNYSNFYRGGSKKSVITFVATSILGLNLFDNSSFNCLQIPENETLGKVTLWLNKKAYVNKAHKKNIAVQYWTINDKETMRELIDLKADAIMTDYPNLLVQVIKEKDN